MMPDATDSVILTMLQENARTSNAEIARALGIAPSAVLERIRKLEQKGTIQGYHARINPEAIGQGLTAFIRVRTGFGDSHQRAMTALAEIPEIMEIHETAGDDCLMLKMRVADMKAFNDLLNAKIRPIEGIVDHRTTVVINTAKESSILQLPAKD